MKFVIQHGLVINFILDIHQTVSHIQRQRQAGRGTAQRRRIPQSEQQASLVELVE